MLEIDTLAALQAIDAALSHAVVRDDIDNGRKAARATFGLMSDAHDRLSPETIIDADDPSLTDTARAKRLWANAKVRNATIRSLADSTVVLARLWAGAWRVGKGNSIAHSKLRVFKEPEIESLYRSSKFAPAMTLDQMAKSGRFKVP